MSNINEIKELISNGTEDFQKFASKLVVYYNDYQKSLDRIIFSNEVLVEQLEAFYTGLTNKNEDGTIAVIKLENKSSTLFAFLYDGKIIICQDKDEFDAYWDNWGDLMEFLKILESNPYKTLSKVLLGFFDTPEVRYDEPKYFADLHELKDYIENEFADLLVEEYVNFDLTI